MSKGLKYIIILAVFVLVLIGCVIGYNNLSEKYQPENDTVAVPNLPEPAPEPSILPQEDEQQPVEDENAPVMAPDFTVYDLEGNEVSLSDMRGKAVVLNFWATWCGPCKGEMPHFQSLYEEYGDRVEFMMVNLTDGAQDTQENVEKFIMENGYTFPVYCDTSLYAAAVYGVYSVPMTFFIGADGEALYYQIGAMSEDMLRGAIEDMLGE